MRTAEPNLTSTPPKPPSHVAALDGLRAIAVFGVMAVHAGTPGSDLGWLGVDIFFVLSGFLITTLLVREYQRTASITLWRFWARRALRLMPAYWLYVAAMTALILGHFGWSTTHGGWSPRAYIASLWGYFVNYAPLGGIWKHQMLTIHLWSLAVEEQFYLLWPGLCWLLLKLRPASIAPAILTWGIVLLVVTYRHFAPDSQLDHLLPTRGLGIVIGAAVALTCLSDFGQRRRALFASSLLRTTTVTLILLIVASLTLLFVKRRIDKPFIYRYGVPPLDILFAIVVAMLWYGPRDRVARLLSWKPVVYFGTISYGLYLYHMLAWFLVWGPLLGGIDHWPKVPKFALRVSTFFGLSIVIASLSYHWLERPFLKLKERVR